MTQPTTEVDEGTVMEIPLTRDEIRSILLGKTPKAKSVEIEVYGVKLSLKQPRFGDIMTAREEQNPAKRAVELITQYAYVPGTEDRVFEDSDMEMILRWPFGEDLVRLQNAIAELTGLNIEEEEANLRKSPLDASS